VCTELVWNLILKNKTSFGSTEKLKIVARGAPGAQRGMHSFQLQHDEKSPINRMGFRQKLM